MKMQNNSRLFGSYAEDLAEDFYKTKGFHTLARNFRFKRFEIDLIVQKAALIVFVEVKARKNNLFGNPEALIATKQMRGIRLVASHYLRLHNHQGPIRFDVIALLGNPKEVIEIMHFPDGFY